MYLICVFISFKQLFAGESKILFTESQQPLESIVKCIISIRVLDCVDGLYLIRRNSVAFIFGPLK